MARRPSIKNLPSRLLEESPTPVFAIASDRTVVYANRALGNLLEIDREQIVGTRLTYRADDHESKLNALCPPPELFASESSGIEFGIHLENTEPLQANGLRLHNEYNEILLVCSLEPRRTQVRSGISMIDLHERIRTFRLNQSARYRRIPFLGDSPAAKRCVAQATALALVESNVNLYGPAGSQIQDLAKAIHYSGFADLENPDPLLPIDCQQVFGDRLREILLGHFEFIRNKDGKERAYVLLISADRLDSSGQQCLLELLDQNGFPARIYSLSRQPLRLDSDFNVALAHCLDTFELEVPPLTERRSDIPVLVQNLLEQSGESFSISQDLLDTLEIFPWVRDYQQLQETVSGACGHRISGELQLEDFPDSFRLGLRALETSTIAPEEIDLDRLLIEVEQQAITRAIQASGGNKTNAARLLGITRARLHRRLAEMEKPAVDGDETGKP